MVPLQQEASSPANITAALVCTAGSLSKMQIWTQHSWLPLVPGTEVPASGPGDTFPFSPHSLFLAPRLGLGEAPELQILTVLSPRDQKVN